MDNNDIIRQIRYTFDFGDDKMIKLFALGDLEVDRATVSDWLKKKDDESFVQIPDGALSRFLNGLMIDKRGKAEGVEYKVEDPITNNDVLKKLKIALTLKDTDILDMLSSVDFNFGKHELSALFRKRGQQQYRLCKDQVLRNFLHGMQLRFRKEIDHAKRVREYQEATKPVKGKPNFNKFKKKK
ncbi:DUF1456 family protein [Persicobacter psychrovividus]|uniref:DUF1456 domain-containing protein n=1 Tax=Persicobacter psychrovividus TaxID=387638 RepID=A0ABM7VD11_9BACT|nr:hypothetical protein PEPS_11060 [Persicobacter psychrovividus]